MEADRCEIIVGEPVAPAASALIGCEREGMSLVEEDRAALGRRGKGWGTEDGSIWVVG